MKEESFGSTADGQALVLIRLENKQGTVVELTNLGAIVVGWKIPDKDGLGTDIVLGFDTSKPYLEGHPCFGTINGRYANRIALGQFTLDGKAHQVTQNHQFGNHLHGGNIGFDKVVWQHALSADARQSVLFQYTSADGEEGYPGTLEVGVRYTLQEDNSLVIEYEASTDAPTVLNLTNHSYFNLAGSGSILDHEVKIEADFFTPIGETVIPTGEIQSVVGTPFDFRAFTSLGARIQDEHEQLTFGSGYDHNFVLRHERGQLGLAATVRENRSKRKLEVFTTEPGVQLYTANHLDGIKGKRGIEYHARHAFCLETQHFPDSPNHPHFPSTVLRPDSLYTQKTVYKFSQDS